MYERVSGLVPMAKLMYSKSKMENDKLAVAEEPGGNNLLPETATDIIERLQSKLP